MIHIDWSSKRVRLAVRFFSYGAMTVVTISLTTVLVFIAMGYRLETGFKFAQGGLVQFNSFPTGANVTIDGHWQNFRTPGSANLTAGNHTVSVLSQGYDTWSKRVSLAAGQLLWLSYVRLIPQHLTTNTVQSFDGVAALLPSPDKHWLLVQASENVPDFTLVDISNPQHPVSTLLHVPDAVLTKSTDNQYGTLKALEWDSGSQNLLLRQTIAGQSDYIWLDRAHPDQAINVSRQFGFTIDEAHFSDTDAATLFVTTGTMLRKLNVNSGSASEVLASGVSQFMVANDNQVAFVARSTQENAPVQEVGIWHDNTIAIIRRLDAAEPIVLSYVHYENRAYLALAVDSVGVDILRDPLSNTTQTPAAVYVTLASQGATQQLLASPGSRMILARQGNHVAVFDLETAQKYQYTQNDAGQPLQWLDDFYLYTNANGSLGINEFDGANPHTLAAVQANVSASLSEDGKYLFSIGKNTAGKTVLQVSQLVLP